MSISPDERCRCPLRKDAARCIRRQNWTPQPRECRVCDFYGRKGTDDTKAATGETKPPCGDTKPVPRGTIPAKPETIQQKKEETVATAKEKILARVQREKAVKKAKFTTHDRIPPPDIEKAAKELKEEGKIKIWPGQREGSFTVTLPDAPDPRTAGTGNNQQQPTAVSKKAVPKKKIGRLMEKKKAPAVGISPPKNGGGRTGSADGAIPALTYVVTW